MGRKSDQVEAGPPDESSPVGGPDRSQTLFPQPVQDKIIDRASRPGGAGHRGRIRLLKRPERPEGALFGGNGVSRGRRRGDQLVAGVRPDGSSIDPTAQILDHPVAELALGRHLQLLMGVGDDADQETAGRISRSNRGPRTSSANQPLPRIQPKISLAGAGVTGVAVFGQQGPDAHLEKLGGGRIGPQQGQNRSQQQPERE